MQNADDGTLLSKQHQFMASGKTRPLAFRLEQLKKLQSLLTQHETDIISALYQDLHKSPTEAVITEYALVMDELKYIIKHLPQWIKPKKVATPFPLLWPGKSAIHYEPFGSVLILGAWNYPLLLVMSPLIGAMCAGNCAIIKPSEIATHTQKLVLQLINNHFPSDYLLAIHAGPEETTQLLQQPFDYIFYTGGAKIGKIVMQAAAQHLTPITLELGGKNPCIIDKTADLDFAARRIARAKTVNAGQTCLAPDYLYIHQSVHAEFTKKLSTALQQFYGDDAEQSDSYARIINANHFARLKKLLENNHILFGGQVNEATLFIAPTLIDNVSWQDPIMQDEIFGPLLPIMTFEHIDEVINAVSAHAKPLALYLFTQDKTAESNILNRVSFGGGCINDCILHVGNVRLPFGGVGASGMGQYHGRHSFETFSHKKSIYQKRFLFDSRIEYPPYSTKKLTWLKRLFSLSH